ncbi:MAG: hypothetical protein V4564_25295 [Pseudomonadota bacterium]
MISSEGGAMNAVRWVFAGLLVMGTANAASAEEPRESTADRVARSFAECRAIAAADLRLSCFDKAATALEASIKSKEVRIVDRADVRKTRRSLFGLALPSIRLFGGGDDDKEEAFTEIKSTVASTRSLANSRVEIRLAEEGSAVWQTTDPMDFPPKAGAAIRIRQGVMGNYFIAVEGRTYRGMRVR